MNMRTLAEPGFWIVAALGGFGCVHWIGARLARPKFARLNDLADSLLADERLTQADRAWLEVVLDDALDRRIPWLATIAAPIAMIAQLFVVINVARDPQSRSIYERKARARLDEGCVRTTVLKTGIDPSQGRLWSSPERALIEKLAFDGQMLSAPLSLMWLAIWGA